MSRNSSSEDTYQHIVDLSCPNCYPDPIETVLLYHLADDGRIESIKCQDCGTTAKPETFERQ